MDAYHDSEWGVPLHDDRRHFEFITLDAAQAGLSWMTILRKRDGYRRAFRGFDPVQVAELEEADLERILADPGVVRNGAKVRSTVTNARVFLEAAAEFGTFDRYVWRFVDGAPKMNRWATAAEVPVSTPEAAALSADLRRRGFKFVGPTMVYAYMQSAGMAMDHLTTCFRWAELTG